MRRVLPLSEALILLCFCLLAALGVGQWLHLPRRTAPASADTTVACADNLRRLNQAVAQYSQDNDEVLPPTDDAPTFRVAVLPYAAGPAVFNCPDTGRPYTPNAALSRKALSALGDDYDAVEVARDSQPHADGLDTVLFLDGTVQHGGRDVADPNALVTDRAKRLALAMTQYVQDADGTLPIFHGPPDFQTALFPYTHSRRVFYSPYGPPFVPNAALSGVSLASLADPAGTVLLQDAPPYVGGAPTTAYVDGHVTHAPLCGHVLWTNGDGTASLWNYITSDGAFTQNTYGPYGGWAAKAIADGGTDGRTRVLWTNSDGTASLWSLDNAAGAGAFTQFSFGPYAGWTAKAVSVGTDNTTHVLWTNTDGTASVWNYRTADGTFTQHAFGPYGGGWAAKALADGGADGQTRVLWTNTNGRMSLWSLDSGAGTFTQNTFGPYAGWAAKAVSVGAGNTTHVLWTNSDGTASLWNYSPADGSFTQNAYGPNSGWAAVGVADGPDGRARVLWDNTSGQMSLWSLDNTVAGGSFTQNAFGPYGGWTAQAVSAAP